MDRYFDKANGPLMRAFDLVYKWLVLNLLFVAFTLLGGIVFGVFPSLFTLFRLSKRLLQDKEEGLPLFTTYKETFFALFRLANVLGLLLVVVGTITVFDLVFLYQNYLVIDDLTVFGVVLSMGGLLLGVLVVGMILFTGLVVAYYERFGVYDTIRFAFFSTLSSPWLLLQLLVLAGLSYLVFSVLISAAPFLGVSLPVWLLVWRYQKTYRRIFTIRTMGALRLTHVRYLSRVSPYLKVLEDIVPATGDLVQVQAMTDLLQSEALDTAASVLLLDGQDQLVGFLLASSTKEGIAIDAMAIDKAHQRQGYGRAMMDHLVQTSDQTIVCTIDGSHLHPALSRVANLASFLTHYGFTRNTDTTYFYSR